MVNDVEKEFLLITAKLKNPLTFIKGTICLLGAGKLGEVSSKQREMLQKANEEVDILNEAIDDLLDRAKARTSNL